MMQNISLSQGLESLSGISENAFSTRDDGFSKGGDSYTEDEQLHFAIAEICTAIANGKITAMAYVTALMAHARRYPNLAQTVMHIEAASIAAAKRIDESLSAGRMPRPLAKTNSRGNEFTAPRKSAACNLIETSPPPLRF